MFWHNFAVGPKKVSLIFDFILMWIFFFLQKWGCMAYFLMPLVPSAIIEWGIFPFFPYLDVPPLPIAGWLAGEEADISKNISAAEKA